jgi:hypothetical protein
MVGWVVSNDEFEVVTGHLPGKGKGKGKKKKGKAIPVPGHGGP